VNELAGYRVGGCLVIERIKGGEIYD